MVELARKPDLAVCEWGCVGRQAATPWVTGATCCEGALWMIMGSVLSSLKAWTTPLSDMKRKIYLLSGMAISGDQWLLFQDCYFTVHTHCSHIHTNKSPAALVQSQPAQWTWGCWTLITADDCVQAFTGGMAVINNSANLGSDFCTAEDMFPPWHYCLKYLLLSRVCGQPKLWIALLIM